MESLKPAVLLFNTLVGDTESIFSMFTDATLLSGAAGRDAIWRDPNRLKEMILTFYSTLIRRRLEYSIQLWQPQHKKNMDLSNRSKGRHKNYQRTGTLLIWNNVESIGVAQLVEECALGRPYCGLSILKGLMTRRDVFLQCLYYKTKSSGFKLKTRFRLDLVWYWKRLLKEAVDAPSQDVIKDRLDGALSNLVL